MEPALTMRNGYLQMHVQNTRLKKAPLIHTAQLTGGTGGIEAYAAHLERQLALARSKSAEECQGNSLDSVAAAMKVTEEKVAQCFEYIQGMQDFCEELARDTHTRFEDAQAQVHRCEKAVRAAVQTTPRADKLEALVQKLVRAESRETETLLRQRVEDRCRIVEDKVAESWQGGMFSGETGGEELDSGFWRRNDRVGEPNQGGVSQSDGVRSERDGVTKVRTGQKTSGRKARLKEEQKAWGKNEPRSSGGPDNDMWQGCKSGRRCCGCGGADAWTEKCNVEKGRWLAAETITSSIGKQVADYPEEAGARGPVSRKEERAGQPEASVRAQNILEGPAAYLRSGSDGAGGPGMRGPNSKKALLGTRTEDEQRIGDGAGNTGVGEKAGENAHVAQLSGEVSDLRTAVEEMQKFRTASAAQASERERLSKTVAELSASVAAFAGDIQKLTSLEASVQGLSGSTGRLSSLEASVDEFSQRLPPVEESVKDLSGRLTSLEESIGRTNDRVKGLSEADRRRTEADSAAQNQTAAALRSHAAAAGALQARIDDVSARVDDVSTLLLGGKGDGQPYVPRSRSPSCSGRSFHFTVPGTAEKCMVANREEALSPVTPLSSGSGPESGLPVSERLLISEGFSDRAVVAGAAERERALGAGEAQGLGKGVSASGMELEPLSALQSRMTGGLQKILARSLFATDINLDESPNFRLKDESNNYNDSETCLGIERSGSVEKATKDGRVEPPAASPPALVRSASISSSPALSPGRFASKDLLFKLPPERGPGMHESRFGGTAERHVDARAHAAAADDGSAYARALAKTEERKRRLDKASSGRFVHLIRSRTLSPVGNTVDLVLDRHPVHLSLDQKEGNAPTGV